MLVAVAFTQHKFLREYCVCPAACGDCCHIPRFSGRFRRSNPVLVRSSGRLGASSSPFQSASRTSDLTPQCILEWLIILPPCGFLVVLLLNNLSTSRGWVKCKDPERRFLIEFILDPQAARLFLPASARLGLSAGSEQTSADMPASTLNNTTNAERNPSIKHADDLSHRKALVALRGQAPWIGGGSDAKKDSDDRRKAEKYRSRLVPKGWNAEPQFERCPALCHTSARRVEEQDQ